MRGAFCWLVVIDLALGLVLDDLSGPAVNPDFLDVAALLDVERIAPAAAFILIFARDDLARSELECERLGARLRDFGCRRLGGDRAAAETERGDQGDEPDVCTHD